MNRARVSPADIVIVYCSLIRSILEYACPVWHSGLTLAQSNDIERVQMRCLRIIYPELSYCDALFISGLEKLNERRQSITVNTFQSIKDPDNAINNVLNLYRPKRDPSLHSIRSVYDFVLPLANINRCLNPLKGTSAQQRRIILLCRFYISSNIV